ncbi:hypothetical protein OnM2_010024 [Erysiphe neolycopersici]|uniref:Uncharacterized protein n=1 Tax=Erysiphe neolycopersici TaxID=212602 RepID=A0A420I6K0_9PEZI|nr:hypothetical protein OnM2_010024 [Erysiphe neolycopersici]
MSTYEIIRSLKHTPKLSRNTFARWSAVFVQVLINHKRDQYIIEGISSTKELKFDSKDSKESISVPIDPSDIEKDGNIKAALLQLVPEDAYYLIEDKPTSKDMWDSLNQYFKSQ